MQGQPVGALLIGGGVAAVRCARTLRRRGFDGSILLVGDEPVPPYNRPPLSKELLRGEVSMELVLAEPESWYARHGIELRLGASVAQLDPEARFVELEDGTRVRFERCLLATGAKPRALTAPGGERARSLRTLADAVALREAARVGAGAVLVGGGFIGVEAAASLAARGARVTLLERGEALWAGSLGRRVSEWATGRLRGIGVNVRFGATVVSLDAGGVLLPDERLAADVILAAVGVAPRVELAEAAGLETDDGVLVDERQVTSAPAVFAAGDVARPRGLARIEHWHSARESGDAAAVGMLGEPMPPRRAPWVFSEFAGSMLDVVGLGDGAADEVELPGLVARVRDDRVVQLAILDGAVSVEAARSLVERNGRASDLAALTG
jgi:3-phenylpropionate/trans-cinnamate dioxygenase ferredoxin reductase subunit